MRQTKAEKYQLFEIVQSDQRSYMKVFSPWGDFTRYVIALKNCFIALRGYPCKKETQKCKPALKGALQRDVTATSLN